MRYRHHWEYRVFGNLRKKIKRHLHNYQPVTEIRSALCDEYLWVPGCTANIKLRQYKNQDKVKFKYLADTTRDGFELWAEDSALKFGFPLSTDAVGRLSSQLGLRPDLIQDLNCHDAASIRAALCDLDNRIKVVTVRKKRKKINISHNGHLLSIEMTRILKPIPIQTMCVEGPDFKRSQPGKSLAGLRQFLNEVNLPRSLEVMGYLQFIGRHATAHA